MLEYTNVVIGIQARSTSNRFPRKVHELIGNKPMLRHVIDACDNAAYYINKHSNKTHISVSICLLVPKGDEIVSKYAHKFRVIEGDEHDVLSRYVNAAEQFKADYMVRVTGDCPMIPSYLITKHITIAVLNKYDYLSNVDERLRVAADGMDCEVISKKLLDHINQSHSNSVDREHVTTAARHSPPSWARIGHVVGFMDLSGVKRSVDTPEDLEVVRAEHDKIRSIIETVEKKHGRNASHRF